MRGKLQLSCQYKIGNGNGSKAWTYGKMKLSLNYGVTDFNSFSAIFLPLFAEEVEDRHSQKTHDES